MATPTLDDIRQTQSYLLSEVEEIVREFRTNDANGNITKNIIAPSIVTATNSPNGIVTKTVSHFDTFIGLPDEFANSLTPQIKVYKTYEDLEGNERNYLLPMGKYLSRVGDGRVTTQGVVVKSAEFTRLGGNPAEIDTNIKFNIKLFAKDISVYFAKNETLPMEGRFDADEQLVAAAIEAHEEESIQEDLRVVGAAIDAAAAANATAAGLPPPTGGGSTMGQQSHAPSITALDGLANDAMDIGPNGERRVAWIDLIKIDPGQPLNHAVDAALLTSEKRARIKVEIGYAEVTDKPIGFKGDTDEFNKWRDAIAAQTEVFYLSLFKHKFDFKGYDGTELSIDFIATGNAKQLSPEADLFHDAGSEKEIESLELMIQRQEEEISKANENETQVPRFEDCITGIEDKIDEAEEAILHYRAVNKLKLLNQLYLDNKNDAQGKYSKVFKRRYKRGKPVEDDATESALKKSSSRRQMDVSYDFISSLRVIATNSDDMASHGISSVDLDASQEGADLGITRDEGDTHNTDLFIFLGDIIESAIEILVPGEQEFKNYYERQNVGFTPQAAVAGGAGAGAAVGGLMVAGVGGAVAATGVGAVAMIIVGLLWRSGNKKAGEKTGTMFRPPFCWYSNEGDGLAVAMDRYDRALSEFGGILTGTVSYTNPNRTKTGKKKTVKIRDIPIALDIFRSWWINTYVKSGKKTLSLRDFIVALMRFVEKEVFASSPLDLGRTEERVDDPKFIVNSIAVSDTTFNRVMYKKFNNTFRNVRASAIFPAWSGDHANDVLTIETVDTNPLNSDAVPNIIFGETSKGILKKVDFQREDIPGHAEARLFSDRASTASNLALREKYNTSYEMIGNTCFKPGSLLYLDPLPLDLGYTEARDSLARSIGLGGMYRVVNLTSNLSFSASGNSWNTKVNTKWESFGDGDNGVSAATNPSPISLGLCIEEEFRYLRAKVAEQQAVIDFQNDRARNRTGTAHQGTINRATREMERYQRLIDNLELALAEDD